MSEQEYLIHELAEKTGVSVRTIRFYIEKGLLPEAPVKGRYAAYSEEYVDRIRLIKRLKEKFLPLEEIRNQIASLDYRQIVQRLQMEEGQETTGPDDGQTIKQPSLPGVQKAVQNYLIGNANSGKLESITGGIIWERVKIVEGIELHFRRPLDSRYHRKINNIIAFAKNEFSGRT